MKFEISYLDYILLLSLNSQYMVWLPANLNSQLLTSLLDSHNDLSL